MSDQPVTRIEVVDPTGRRFIVDMSPEVAQYTYAAYLGYVTRIVVGYPTADGFRIVNRRAAVDLPHAPSDVAGEVKP